MNEKLLELQLQILMLQYSRQKILHAVARLSELTPEELERQLRTVDAKKRAKRPKPLITNLAAAKCQERPEIAEPLRTLSLGFQNRTFLPHLRDVQRFLDQVGSKQGKLRSREAAGSLLVRTLAGLPKERLLLLAAENNSPGESDYGLLARAIMGAPAPKPHEQGNSDENPRDT